MDCRHDVFRDAGFPSFKVVNVIGYQVSRCEVQLKTMIHLNSFYGSALKQLILYEPKRIDLFAYCRKQPDGCMGYAQTPWAIDFIRLDWFFVEWLSPTNFLFFRNGESSFSSREFLR